MSSICLGDLSVTACLIFSLLGAPQRPTIIPEGAGVPPSYRTPPPPRGSSPPPPSSGALVPQAPPPPAPQSGVNRLLGALKKRTNWLKKGELCAYMSCAYACIGVCACAYAYIQ